MINNGGVKLSKLNVKNPFTLSNIKYKLNENTKSLYKNNIPQNMNKLSRMKEVVHKYYDILDIDIKEVFEEVFQEVFQEIFSENIKNKLPIQTKVERKLSIKDKNTTNIKIYTLVPEIYYKEINGNLIIEDTTEIFIGSFGTVYKSIFLTTNNISTTKLSSTILKIIEEKNSNNPEFKSLIFNICLLSYLYLQNNDGIKYFCDLYEFGKIKDSNNKFYAIMEDCGYDLFFYFNKIRNINFINSSYNDKLFIILYIIRECAKALKVLHDINIAHNDVKPDNFLIKKDNGNYYIKIIDFGFARKFGSIIDFSKGNVNFSTKGFIPYNFYYNTYYKKEYRVDKKCDIYGLGISFLELLCNISNCDKSIIDLKISVIIKSSINHKIQTIIDNIISYLKRNIKINKTTGINKNTDIKQFIMMLENTLKTITYLSGYYKDLSEFISDMDILIGLLKII
jgi:serine/threonine protein kinase